MTLLKSFCQVNGFLTWLCFMALGQGKKKPSSLDKKFDQVLESRNNNPLDSLAVWVKSQDTRNIMRHWKKNPPEQSVRRRPTAAILYYVELCPTQTNKREKKGHLLWRLGHPQIPAHDGRSTKPYKKTQKRFQDKASGGNADPLQRNRHHHHQQHRTQSKKKTRLLSFPFFLHEYYIMNVRTPPRRRPFSYATTVMITVLAVFCCLGLLFWNLSNDDLSPLLLICVVWLTVCLRILVKLGNV